MSTTKITYKTGAPVSYNMLPPGPRGISGDSSYMHVQSSPSNTWTINHNLEHTPAAVSVLDSARTVCTGRVEHPTINQTIIKFGSPFSGTAYLR